MDVAHRPCLRGLGINVDGNFISVCASSFVTFKLMLICCYYLEFLEDPIKTKISSHAVLFSLAKQGPRGGALDDFERWEVIQMVGLYSRIYQIATSSAGGAVRGGGG